MTQRLEELFDLPQDADPIEEPEETPSTETEIVTTEALSNLEKIDAALPTVRDINTSDEELDRLSKLAEDGFSELMELGMNVEPMKSSEIFTTASSLLGHAIHAKNAKVQNKLRVVQLQIQKARLDLQSLRAGEGDDPIDGESVLLDRNAILDAILEKKN